VLFAYVLNSERAT